MSEVVSSRSCICLHKTLFYTINYTAQRVKFEIGDKIRDRMSKLQKLEEDIFRRGDGERMRGFTHATSSVRRARFGAKSTTIVFIAHRV